MTARIQAFIHDDSRDQSAYWRHPQRSCTSGRNLMNPAVRSPGIVGGQTIGRAGMALHLITVPTAERSSGLNAHVTQIKSGNKHTRTDLT
jgi:hypothetical protein